MPKGESKPALQSGSTIEPCHESRDERGMRDCDRGDDTTKRQGHAGVIGPFAGFQAVRSAAR